MKKDKLIIIDGNSLINRAYYALPPLVTAKGEYSNAVYGFTTMLIKLISEQSPKYFAVCFDLPHPTFRHQRYKQYKATRKGMPHELACQMPILKELLACMNISILQKEGFEADDLVGTIAKRYGEGREVVIVTGDRDCLQLIDDNTTVFLTKRGLSEVAEMNPATLQQEFGLQPQGIIELKGLAGDASDNIPGVAGVGEKTAVSLISKYGNVEGVYNSIDEISGKLKEKLIEGREMAFLSKELASINTSVDIECGLDQLVYDYPFNAKVRDMFARLEFKSLLKKTDLFFEEQEVKAQLVANVVEVDNAEQLLALLPNKPSVIAMHFGKEFHLAVDGETEYIVPIADGFFSIGEHEINLVKTLQRHLADDDVLKVVFCYKDILTSVGEAFKAVTRRFDVQLAQYLVNPAVPHDSFKSFLEHGYAEEKFSAVYLLSAYQLLCKDIEEMGLHELFYNIEMPVSEVLFDMERNGFALDRRVISELRAKYKQELAELEKQIFVLSGEPFNINSPKQLGVVLFEKLGLSAGKKSKSGNYSTSIEVLENLSDQPIVGAVLRYRSVSKMLSTYIEGFERQIKSDGRVHTEFKQTVTVTGRLSSAEPNLQNLPIREEEGRLLRKMFCASPDHVLVSADYSQIELRLLAHFSQDTALLSAYRSGLDIHTATASIVAGVSPSEVTAEMRRSAKAVNFGIVYGISDFGLAKQLNISVFLAKKYITKYFETYPRVKEYLDGLVEQAKKQGYLTSMCGRVRHFPELKSSNYNIRSFGERAAMNMPLQASSADLIKIAMLNVAKLLKGMKSKLILQVHDELVIDAHKDEVEAVRRILKEQMENSAKLSVELVVEVGEGASLYDTK